MAKFYLHYVKRVRICDFQGFSKWHETHTAAIRVNKYIETIRGNMQKSHMSQSVDLVG